MKKWLVVSLIVCFAAAVQAGDKSEKKDADKGESITKEAYMAKQQKMAEKKGEEFDQAAAEKKFKKMDANKDGVLTGAEIPQKKEKKKEADPE